MTIEAAPIHFILSKDDDDDDNDSDDDDNDDYDHDDDDDGNDGVNDDDDGSDDILRSLFLATDKTIPFNDGCNKFLTPH